MANYIVGFGRRLRSRSSVLLSLRSRLHGNGYGGFCFFRKNGISPPLGGMVRFRPCPRCVCRFLDDRAGVRATTLPTHDSRNAINYPYYFGGHQFQVNHYLSLGQLRAPHHYWLDDVRSTLDFKNASFACGFVGLNTNAP